jgi:hypothetical protein
LCCAGGDEGGGEDSQSHTVILHATPRHGLWVPTTARPHGRARGRMGTTWWRRRTRTRRFSGRADCTGPGICTALMGAASSSAVGRGRLERKAVGWAFFLPETPTETTPVGTKPEGREDWQPTGTSRIASLPPILHGLVGTESMQIQSECSTFCRRPGALHTLSPSKQPMLLYILPLSRPFAFVASRCGQMQCTQTFRSSAPKRQSMRGTEGVVN